MPPLKGFVPIPTKSTTLGSTSVSGRRARGWRQGGVPSKFWGYPGMLLIIKDRK